MWLPALGLHALHKPMGFPENEKSPTSKTSTKDIPSKAWEGKFLPPSQVRRGKIGVIFMTAITSGEALQRGTPILSRFPIIVGNFLTAAATPPFMGRSRCIIQRDGVEDKGRVHTRVFCAML